MSVVGVVLIGGVIVLAPILPGRSGCLVGKDEVEIAADVAGARYVQAEIELCAFASRARARWPGMSVTYDRFSDSEDPFARFGMSRKRPFCYYVETLQISRAKGDLSLQRDGGFTGRRSIAGVAWSAASQDAHVAIVDEFERLDAILHGSDPATPSRTR